MEEKELGEMANKIKNIEKILLGNGTKGLLKKMDEITSEVIPEIKIALNSIKSYGNIKHWILGGLVTVLFGTLMLFVGLRIKQGG